MSNHRTPGSDRSEQTMTVNQPTRSGDVNQGSLSATAEQSADPLLPTLDDGITLLDIEGTRGVPIIQSLVLDHLMFQEGPAFWIDSNGYATTTSLARLSPSQQLLDRIHVARGFTIYQHFGVLCDLPTAINQHIRQTLGSDTTREDTNSSQNTDTTSLTPTLIVA
ncbi:MAG: hypothetical protein ABEI86_09290, partial [Halobacteriaceae archaeon]